MKKQLNQMKLSLAKKMEKMGSIPFEMNPPMYVLIMSIYVVLIPVWLPVYLVAKWIEVYKEEIN